jgi:mevalonate kinase
VASASGKVILCGEHAVVYGCPAIAIGIDRGVRATAEPAERAELFFGEAPVSDEETSRAYRALLDALGGPSVRTRVTLEMPHGVGLGASAAVAVAIARSVVDLETALRPAGEDAEQRLLDAANAWETVFHQNPSGVDTACAMAGGCIRFRRHKGFERLAVAHSFELLVAVAGPPMPTRQMVESVARIRERASERFQRDLEAIEALVGNAALCLSAGDLQGLGKLLDYNHMLLSSWLVSTNEIEDAIRLARANGAFGAKLTGAGGGGCVIALPGPGASAEILEAWQAHGFQCFATQVASAPARLS